MVCERPRMLYLGSWKNRAEVGRLKQLAEICTAQCRAYFLTKCLSFTDWRQRYLDEHMKHIFFLILSTLAFFSCTPSEPAKKYTLDCYARFDEQAGKLTAEATMSESALPPKPVEVPGGIRYQRVAMTLVPVIGLKYQHAYPADFTKEHSFEWKNAAGKTLEFNMHMNALDSISFDPKVVSRKQPARFSWKGAPLEKGEALVFIWENTEKGQTIPVELYNIGTSNIIDFPAVKMAEIPAGNWSYYVVRKRLTKAVVDGVEVRGITEFYSKSRPVKVVD